MSFHCRGRTIQGPTYLDHEAPLGELTLYRDWDYYASMARSLKSHFEAFGGAPLWNPQFCGGRPELSLPHGIAFTWYSPLFYVAPAYPAMFLVWVLLTLVGLGSAYLLLVQWTGERLGAAVGATLYALTGYFASHFNQGHLSFAFFHLVPLMVLLAERWLAKPAAERGRGGLIATALVSAAFFTAALPHALFYLYPALLGWSAWRAWKHRRDLRAVMALGAAHACGVMLSLYKLWPAVDWQRRFPRQGVLAESTSPLDVLLNSVRWTEDFVDPMARAFEGQTWFSWEYNWYVGLGAWLVALAGIGAYAMRRRLVGTGGLLAAGGILVVGGTWLAMGNDHPLGIAAAFEHLPLVKGIRTFGRYQVLCLVGLALWVAAGFKALHALAGAASRVRLYGGAVAALLVLAPGIAQTATLVAAIPAKAGKDLGERLPYPPLEGMPQFATQGFDVREGWTFQDELLKRGYYVRDCYEPMALKRTPPESPVQALSHPAPRAIETTFSRITLSYANPVPADTQFAFPQYEFLKKTQAGSNWVFDVADEMWMPGVIASGVGMALLALLVALWPRVRGRS